MSTPLDDLTPAQAIDRIADEMSLLAGQLTAGTHRLIELIGEFDRRGGCGMTGARSTAHYLTWRCGIALRSAREHVRVARALPRLPAIREAFRLGEISYSKVRAITRVATEVDESYFLNLARSGTASHVERIVQLSRRYATDKEDRHAAATHVDERRVTARWEEDGSLRLEAHLPPDDAAVLLAALRASHEALWEEDRAAKAEARHAAGASEVENNDAAFQNSRGVSHSVKQNGSAEHSAETEERARRSHADALVAMAEAFLANPTPSQRAAGDRYHVIVHLNEGVYGSRALASANIDDEVAVPLTTARRLACDCSRTCVHEDGRGQPLGIERRSRQIPAGLRRALQIRDRGCRFPGCTSRRYVDGHHIQHWIDGGETSLENLVLLCRHHHRLVHEGSFGVDVTASGDIVFLHHDGRILPASPPPPPPRNPAHAIRSLANHHAKQGLRITSRTILPDWHGERLDEVAAIDLLVHRRFPLVPT